MDCADRIDPRLTRCRRAKELARAITFDGILSLSTHARAHPDHSFSQRKTRWARSPNLLKLLRINGWHISCPDNPHCPPECILTRFLRPCYKPALRARPTAYFGEGALCRQ